MDILVIILIVCNTIRNSYAVKNCLPEVLTNCAVTDAKYILVSKVYPNVTCSMTKIDETKFIFDHIAIIKVGITVYNNGSDCSNSSMVKLTKNLSIGNKTIIFIEVKDEYLRLIFVTEIGGFYQAEAISPTLEQALKNLNLVLFPAGNDLDKLGKVCLNNGVLDTLYEGAGEKCICPRGNYMAGQRCEYVDRSLNSAIYFFDVFRDPKSIKLSFSLFSNGVKEQQALVTIRNSRFQMLVELRSVESELNLITLYGNTTKTFLRIDNQNWLEFYMDVTTKGVSVIVPGVTPLVNMNLPFTAEVTDSFLSHYLILKADNLNVHKICLKNVKLNSQILDLNDGNSEALESCCSERCTKKNCSDSEECICTPYVSESTTKCFCKIGFEKIENVCKSRTVNISQIEASKSVSFTVTDVLNRIDCRFKTRSTEGTLLFLVINDIINITVKIVDKKLCIMTMNQCNNSIDYNISDGKFHTVMLNIYNYSLELVLDDNSYYGVTVQNWRGSALEGKGNSTITIGPLSKPPINPYNKYPTCLSDIVVNAVSDKQQYITIRGSGNVTPQCMNGTNCTEVKCLENEQCSSEEWQDTKCICKSNFTSSAQGCIFMKCVVNPCQNGGLCVFSLTRNDYICNCVNSYIGDNCENEAAKAGLWWIAILIVLLLLLIILVVLLIYCCCYRKHQKPDSPSIDKIHENTVIYNDQAGECDYNGPPINYDLMKAALYNKESLARDPPHQTPDFVNRKMDLDRNNNDLVLDYPLEYGYEGYNSENDSVSSLGSKSTDSQLNTLPLDNSNKRFNYLSDLYK